MGSAHSGEYNVPTTPPANVPHNALGIVTPLTTTATAPGDKASSQTRNPCTI
jgi:hypothetical protein